MQRFFASSIEPTMLLFLSSLHAGLPILLSQVVASPAAADATELTRRRDLIRLLLAHGADPLLLNENYETPLSVASPEEFKLLLLAHLDGKEKNEN